VSYTISESEWKIMQVLWHGGSLPLKEIIEQVAPQNGWNGNTVRTLVVRLVEKGVVLAEKRGRNYRYAAAVAEQACILKETEHFLGRIFDGSPARLFSALSSGGKLTKEDCQEIEAMLRALKERE
jgi:predicted transcriptional regulator